LDVHAVCAEGGAVVAEKDMGERRAGGAAAMTQGDGCTIGAKRRALKQGDTPERTHLPLTVRGAGRKPSALAERIYL
jgi:hypothetical protein